METIFAQIKQLTNNYITKTIDTGDKIIDVAINVIIMALIDMIIKYINSYCKKLYNREKLGKNPWEFDPLKVKKISEDEVKKYKYNTHCEYNVSIRLTNKDRYFSDLVYKWIETTFGEKCSRLHSLCCDLSTNDNCNYGSGGLLISNKNITDLIVNVTEVHRKYIFMPIWGYYDKGNIEYIYIYNQYLWSNSMEELNKFIKHISKFVVEKYEAILPIQEKQLKSLEIVELQESWKPDKSDFAKSYKNVGYVNKNKTFDKIFFDEKEKLLEMIDKYQNKTIYPSGLGLDNKLGILLYGPPGTGKTGTIFCVANLLQKPILLINSLKVKKSTIISAVNEVKKTHIIVLDEFDHLLQELKIDNFHYRGGFFNDGGESHYYPHHHHVLNVKEKAKIMEKHLLFENDDNTDNNSKDNNSKDSKDGKDTKNDAKNDDKIEEKTEMNYKDLPNDVFMYKLLDSFGDDDDRIIIATTNNPNMVNPVLLRPGRFDMKLCLGYCSMNMFINIAQKVYDINTYIQDPNNLEKIKCILTLNITPLILINSLILSKSLEECIDKLSKQKQKSYNRHPEEDDS